MKISRLPLAALLLSTSALAAPGLAFAQDASAAMEPPQDDVVDEIVVVGEFIPTPMRRSSFAAGG